MPDFFDPDPHLFRGAAAARPLDRADLDLSFRLRLLLTAAPSRTGRAYRLRPLPRLIAELEVIRLNNSGESIHSPRLVEAIRLAAGTGARTELVAALASIPPALVPEPTATPVLDRMALREVASYESSITKSLRKFLQLHIRLR